MDLFLVFLTGVVFGAGHCVGMCGGFVTAYTLARPCPSSRTPLTHSLGSIPSHLAYNFGRLTTYTLVGGLMGLIGSQVNDTSRLLGVQGAATTAAGLMMILWAIAKFRGRTLFEAGRTSLFRMKWLRDRFRDLTRVRNLTGPLILGLLLGFLPCGLLATMQIKAAGTGSISGGMLVMFVFGLGTAPALIAFGTLSAWLTRSLRERLDHVAAVLVFSAGILSLLRGLAANGIIPHVNRWLW